jgi:hypothetical protein
MFPPQRRLEPKRREVSISPVPPFDQLGLIVGPPDQQGSYAATNPSRKEEVELGERTAETSTAKLRMEPARAFLCERSSAIGRIGIFQNRSCLLHRHNSTQMKQTRSSLLSAPKLPSNGNKFPMLPWATSSHRTNCNENNLMGGKPSGKLWSDTRS